MTAAADKSWTEFVRWCAYYDGLILPSTLNEAGSVTPGVISAAWGRYVAHLAAEVVRTEHEATVALELETLLSPIMAEHGFTYAGEAIDWLKAQPDLADEVADFLKGLGGAA